MKEKLPIKFFAKREEDKQRVEGMGSKELPKFVLYGNELNEKSAQLSKMVFEAMEEDWENRNIPVIIEAKLNADAHAKSHRKKIEYIFFTNKNNVVGVSDENTLIIRVDSKNDGDKIKEKIIDVKNNAYGISCIDKIIKYRPHIYKAEGKCNYKVKLLNFNENVTNKSNRQKFEELLRDENIDFIRTNYTKSLIIYKLSNMTNAKVDKLTNNTLFDLTEEFVPMPKISINLDALNKKDKIKVKEYDSSKKSSIVGVLDNGISKIEPLKSWLYGKRNSPYPNQSISESHGTFVAGVITYGDEFQGTEVVGAKNVRIFDAAVFPDTQKESIEEDELVENIREIIKNNHKEIKIWNLSISIVREISEQKFSDFAIALDGIQDEYNVLICKSAGNCTNFAIGNVVGKLHEGG